MNNAKKLSLFRNSNTDALGFSDVEGGIQVLTDDQMKGMIVGRQNGPAQMWDKVCTCTDPKTGYSWPCGLVCVPYWLCTSWHHGTCGPCLYSDCSPNGKF